MVVGLGILLSQHLRAEMGKGGTVESDLHVKESRTIISVASNEDSIRGRTWHVKHFSDASKSTTELRQLLG